MTITNDIPRPPLRYFGGKWQLAPWIISHFPVHRTYTEAFGGGASVLLRKPRSHAEVYNDLSADIVNVFRVLRDPARACELSKVIELTPFSRDEFRDTDWENFDSVTDEVERARRMIFRSLAGFGSNAISARNKTGFRSNSGRSGTTPARDWMHYPECIRAFTERLKGVVIENIDALQVLTRHDGPETLHYVDPPYVQETRGTKGGYHNYQHDMSDQDHERLAEALHELDGMVIVSGYRCELYEDLFGDWERRDRSHFADGARARVESLWLNDLASSRTPGQRLFDEVG